MDLLALAVSVSLLVTILALALAFAGPATNVQIRTRLQGVLSGTTQVIDAGAIDPLRRTAPGAGVLHGIISGQWLKRMERDIRLADSQLQPMDLVALRVALIGVGFVVAFVAISSALGTVFGILGGLAAGAVGFQLPAFWLSRRRKSRIAKLEHGCEISAGGHDRFADCHANRRSTGEPLVAAHHRARTPQHAWDDRFSSRGRDLECTQIELGKTRPAREAAFREEHEDATVANEPGNRLGVCNGSAEVIALDEHSAQPSKKRPGKLLRCEFLLGNKDRLARNKGGHQQYVDIARMIEDEHGIAERDPLVPADRGA